MGLGDLRLNSGTFRPPESPAPVRIYMGEQVVYESEKVYNFRIARDGTSFAVHEPLAGDASRLVVHNLDLRTERHFDLGTRHDAGERLRPRPHHALHLGRNGSHVLVDARRLLGQRRFTGFYPAGEGSMRHIVVSGVVDGDSPARRGKVLKSMGLRGASSWKTAQAQR